MAVSHSPTNPSTTGKPTNQGNQPSFKLPNPNANWASITQNRLDLWGGPSPYSPNLNGGDTAFSFEKLPAPPSQTDRNDMETDNETDNEKDNDEMTHVPGVQVSNAFNELTDHPVLSPEKNSNKRKTIDRKSGQSPKLKRQLVEDQDGMNNTKLMEELKVVKQKAAKGKLDALIDCLIKHQERTVNLLNEKDETLNIALNEIDKLEEKVLKLEEELKDSKKGQERLMSNRTKAAISASQNAAKALIEKSSLKTVIYDLDMKEEINDRNKIRRQARKTIKEKAPKNSVDSKKVDNVLNSVVDVYPLGKTTKTDTKGMYSIPIVIEHSSNASRMENENVLRKIKDIRCSYLFPKEIMNQVKIIRDDASNRYPRKEWQTRIRPDFQTGEILVAIRPNSEESYKHKFQNVMFYECPVMDHDRQNLGMNDEIKPKKTMPYTPQSSN